MLNTLAVGPDVTGAYLLLKTMFSSGVETYCGKSL